MLSRASFGVSTGSESSGSDSNFNLARWRLFLFVVLPSWLFYLALLSPSITQGGDCGELVSASYRLGIAHPSGYAIWSLMGRTFALLPFGEIAWRYNLFSSICGAISAGILALATFEILIQPRFYERAHHSSALWGALSCGFLFAGFYFAASQFVIAEVYSLASLWGSLLLWLALRWHFWGDWRDALGLSFCAGLAPLVHLSTVFALPWLFVFSVWKKRFSAAKLVPMFGLFSLGLIFICYFPLRSSHFPPISQQNISGYAFYPLDWSHPSDFSQIKAHVTAQQYRGLLIQEYQVVENGEIVTRKRLRQPVSEIPKRLNDLLTFIPMQFLWATPLVFLGAFKSFKIRLLGLLLLVILVCNIGVQINYSVPDQTNFFFPAYFVMAIWMGIGWYYIFDFAFRRGGIISKAAPMLLLATVLSQWSIFALTMNAAGETQNRDLALTQAKTAQKFAQNTGKTAFIFFGNDDSMWRFWYTKFVLEASPNVETPWGRRHYKRREDGKWIEDVGARKHTGPVLMANWDAQVDRRYPYVLVENTGLLWLASDRALPAAAVATGQLSNKSGMITAKIRRNALWRKEDNNDANVLSGILLALDVEFVLPAEWKSRNAQGFNRSVVPNVQSGGDIEIRVGEKGAIQKRRLMLPSTWKAGQVFKTTLPLEININTKAGRYGLWTRLSNSPLAAEVTSWKKTDFLQVGR